MTAHLTCSICGRYPWQELEVRLTEDGTALCNGDDCGEVAAKMRAPRRGSRALLAMAMLTAAVGGVGMPGARRPEPEPPTQVDPAAVDRRIRRAEEKRARRAAKRRRPS